MLKIIPAIDIIEGKCVRLTQGNFEMKRIYAGSPVEMAKKFEDLGCKRLHIVDLDGARTGSLKNLRSLEEIAGKTNMITDYGGGIKSESDFISVFNAGAAMASVGSLPIKQKSIFQSCIAKFGAGKIFPGADVIEEKLAIHGWSEKTEISIFDFLKELLGLGITEVFCTDVSKDGLLEGPAVELYKEIKMKFSTIQITASGGVANLTDLEKLEEAGCAGVIIGKAIYEEKFSLKDALNQFIQ